MINPVVPSSIRRLLIMCVLAGCAGLGAADGEARSPATGIAGVTGISGVTGLSGLGTGGGVEDGGGADGGAGGGDGGGADDGADGGNDGGEAGADEGWTEVAGSRRPVTCGNFTYYCWDEERYTCGCKECAASSSTRETRDQCDFGSSSSGQSVVGLLTMEHFHTATDFAAVGGSAGGGTCAPCGGGAPTPASFAALPRLEIHRVHRYRLSSYRSSFGRGVFANFDCSLRLERTAADGSGSVVLERPYNATATTVFEEVSAVRGDSQQDGILHPRSQALRDCRLYDAAGMLVADHRLARSAVVTALNGDRLRFEIVRISANPTSTILAGRLLAREDAHGRGVVCRYVHPADASDAELEYRRDRLWRLSDITDAYGSRAAITYGVNGYISRIATPSGGTIDYRYDQARMLIGITHPDQAESRFSFAVEEGGNATLVSIDDPGADTTHRRKTLRLTNAVWVNPDDPTDIQPQSANLCTQVLNGDGEVSFQLWVDNRASNDWTTIYVHEGGNRLRRLMIRNHHGVREVAYAVGWQAGQAPWQADFEVVSVSEPNELQQRLAVIDAAGRATRHIPVPGAWRRGTSTFPDGSTIEDTYGPQMKPVRSVDRDGRVTLSTYSPEGDLLSRTTAAGTPDEATEKWVYENGLCIAHIDQLGRRTDYSYDARGLPFQVIEHETAEGGVEVALVTSFTYDALARLVAVRDARGQTTSFAYDQRNRLVTTTYPDATVETVMYGSGVDANLVVGRVSRLGVVTRLGYDLTGRLTSTIEAHGLPEAALTTITYLPGTPLRASTTTDGERITYGYDGHNRLVQTRRIPRAGVELIESLRYDALGQVLERTDVYGRRTVYAYDADGRVLRQVSERVRGTAVDPATAVAAWNAQGPGATVQPDDGAQPDPAAWQGYDIGDAAPAGTCQVAGTGDAATWTITGGGDEMWGYTDQFHFRGRILDGDGAMTARLVEQTRVHAWSKTGLMVRRGIGPSAPYAAIMVAPDYGLFVNVRRCADGVTDYLQATTGPIGQVWLGVSTSGRTVRLWASPDGSTWKLFAAVDLEPAGPAVIGPMVLSHVQGQSSQAVYDHVGFRALARTPDATELASWYLPRLVREAHPDLEIIDHEYSPAGLMLSRIDGRGLRSAYRYDGQGRLVEQREAVRTPDLAVTSYAYDLVGNRIAVTGPGQAPDHDGGMIPQRTEMTYTARNLLASVTEAVGTPVEATVRRLTYSPTRKVLTDTDALGRVTHYGYGGCCDRLLSITDPAGFMTAFTYDAVGNRLTVTDGNGLTTRTAYDARNRVVAVTDPSGAVTRYVYDGSLSDGIGVETMPAVSAILPRLGLGQGTDDTLPPGVAAAALPYREEVDGSAIAVRDPNGASSVELRDGLGRMVARIDALGHATTVGYDTVVDGLVETAQTDALGHVTRARADGAGRVRQQIDALGEVSTARYDANGNQVRVRDAQGLGWDAHYDSRNRLQIRTGTRVDQDATTTWSYDAAGNRLSETDAMRKTEISQYDARNRRIAMIDRLGGVTRFGYDAVGNLISISDADNPSGTVAKTTQYAYDARNLLIAEAFPQGQQGRTLRRYGYDAGRRLISRRVGILSGSFAADAAFAGAETVTVYAYDAANRLTERGYADGLNDSFAYDAAGRLIVASSTRYGNVVERSYNADGSLAHEQVTVQAGRAQGLAVVPAVWPVQYGYDADHRTVSITYPDGSVVSRSYTDRNELSGVTLDGAAVNARTYDASGRLVQQTWGNGLAETRSYVAGDHLVASLAVPGVTGFGYQYDAAGRKLAETDGVVGGGQSFAYDDAGRLVNWQAGAATQSWHLSLVGDWRSTTRNGVVEPRVNTAVHEAVQVGSAVLAYDIQGNLTRDERGTALAWDPENRLVRALVGADEARYEYDALGRQIQKQWRGVVTTYVPAGAQTIQEVESRPVATPAQAAGDGTLADAARSPEGGGILRPLRGAAAPADWPGTVLRVNFQPASSEIPVGYVADKGRTYAERSHGMSYGWSADRQSEARQRYVVADQAADSLVGMDGVTWRVGVPNGIYLVAVLAGDAASAEPVNNLDIGGQRLRDPEPRPRPGRDYAQGDFDGYLTLVQVTDGQMRVAPGAGAITPRLCTLEMTPIPQVRNIFGLLELLRAVLESDARLGRWVRSLNTQTAGRLPEPQGVKAFVYGSYVDEVVAYQQTVNGVTKRYYPHYNHLYSVAALTDAVTKQVVERYTYDAYGKQTKTVMPGQIASGFGRGFTGYVADNETGWLYARTRYFSSSFGLFASRDRSGYVDGFSVYQAYFVPGGLDPFGNIVNNLGDPKIDKYNRTMSMKQIQAKWGSDAYTDVSTVVTVSAEMKFDVSLKECCKCWYKAISGSLDLTVYIPNDYNVPPDGKGNDKFKGRRERLEKHEDGHVADWVSTYKDLAKDADLLAHDEESEAFVFHDIKTAPLCRAKCNEIGNKKGADLQDALIKSGNDKAEAYHNLYGTDGNPVDDKIEQ